MYRAGVVTGADDEPEDGEEVHEGDALRHGQLVAERFLDAHDCGIGILHNVYYSF